MTHILSSTLFVPSELELSCPEIRRGKGLSDLPQGTRLICRGAGIQGQGCLTPGFFLSLTLPLFLLWPQPSPSFLPWALALALLISHPQQLAAKRPGDSNFITSWGGRSRCLGLRREKRKMDKPQAWGPLTCHLFVCKVVWHTGGGYSQSMVLLGILKESRTISGQGKTVLNLLLCEAVIIAGKFTGITSEYTEIWA